MLESEPTVPVTKNGLGSVTLFINIWTMIWTSGMIHNSVNRLFVLLDTLIEIFSKILTS